MSGAGQLDASLAFDAPIAIGNGAGGTRLGWAESVTCRGHIRYLRGGEAVMQARLQGRLTVVITIRAANVTRAIGPDWRCRHPATGRVYDIRSITPSDDRQYLDLTCETGGPGA